MLMETFVTALPAGITASGKSGGLESAGSDMTRRPPGRCSAISSDPTVLCKHTQLSASGAAQAGDRGGTPVHLSNVMLSEALGMQTVMRKFYSEINQKYPEHAEGNGKVSQDDPRGFPLLTSLASMWQGLSLPVYVLSFM